jgi:hypothetical protein
MNGRFKFAVCMLLAGTSLSCQSKANGPAEANVFSVPSLGLRYTPPAGMIDRTSPAGKDARTHAAEHTSKTTDLILDMSSDEADTAPAWHQIWIFIYPRTQLSGLTDAAAEAKMNVSLAGPRSIAVGQPQSTVLSGLGFTISQFEQKEPPLIKHAKIFTTICKSQLVSFALVSNSEEQLSALEESLKTLDFSGH